ncbi:MAG: IS200/IS605 family transposase, partial [Sediminibacterium sp.]
MSYTKVFIHYVWATRRRKHMLFQPNRELLFDHMKQNALLKGIILDRINGYTNHVHCLVWLKPQQTLDHVAQLLKGESSYWYNNKSGIAGTKLQWQEDYFAASVSLSIIGKVRNYIDNQEKHHQKKTFEE